MLLDKAYVYKIEKESLEQRMVKNEEATKWLTCSLYNLKVHMTVWKTRQRLSMKLNNESLSCYKDMAMSSIYVTEMSLYYSLFLQLEFESPL